MDEEDKTGWRTVLVLTQKERDQLALALQWPEDRAAFKQLITPIPIYF